MADTDGGNLTVVGSTMGDIKIPLLKLVLSAEKRQMYAGGVL